MDTSDNNSWNNSSVETCSIVREPCSSALPPYSMVYALKALLAVNGYEECHG